MYFCHSYNYSIKVKAKHEEFIREEERMIPVLKRANI